MTITKTWNIVNMKTKSIDKMDDVVVEVSWELIGIDDSDGTTSKLYDTSYLSLPSQDSFIDFESLTKTQVINWVKNYEESEVLESAIETTIENTRKRNKRKQEVSNKLPASWS